MPAVLSAVLDLLRCPVCGGGLAEGEGVLRCGEGHSFDIDQGYVNLVPGPGDTAEMVEARDAFLAAGRFARLSTALADEAPAAGAGGTVVDIGAGTGHHLARVLDALPEARGIAIDSSPAALRRAARAHPRAAAVGADVWRDLPLRDGVAALILSVFAPRNPTEMARVLAPGGALLAVTPTTRHLFELVGPLGLISVPDDKEDRLDEQLGPHFKLSERRALEHAMFLNREEAAHSSAWARAPGTWTSRPWPSGSRSYPDPLTVTASMTLSRYLEAA